VTLYLDSSVVLRVLFAEKKRLDAWGRWQRAFASELLGLEVRRAIDRVRILGHIDDRATAALLQHTATIEEALSMVPLTRTILRRAALPMATPVRTLDAIHLATALVMRERTDAPLTFATHDARQADAARALGFSAVGDD
jgi:predicted nucleic acid-binding protein